ncbi:MAG: hypothetical protein KDE68_11195 [Rhodocyclaceae bacterium]|nr:hypothetical protein [Rhodocyclaceae bacterium]
MMRHAFLSLLAVFTLNACGVADTATSAATVGEAKSREIEQARANTAHIQQQLDAANARTMERLNTVDRQ